MKFFLFICMIISFMQADKFIAYTEEMPPYNYIKNSKVVGYSVAKLKEIIEKSSLASKGVDIKVAPWTRSYHEVLNTKDSILFSTVRTASREKLFKWVGPIDTMSVGLIAKKSRHLKVKNVDDLNKYKIGTLNEGMAEIRLLKMGIHVKTLDRFFDIKAQVKKLVDNRIDMIAFSVPAVYHFLEEMGENSDEYELVHLIKEVGLYYAFNKDTDTKIIEELNFLLKK